MPVEAMAAGAAVLASDVGGTAESIVDGVSGVLCDFRSPADCMAAVDRLSGLLPTDARRRARLFSAERFDAHFLDWIAPPSSASPHRMPAQAGPIAVATR